jgi:hypothetical protein
LLICHTRRKKRVSVGIFYSVKADTSARLESLSAVYMVCLYGENLPTVLHIPSQANHKAQGEKLKNLYELSASYFWIVSRRIQKCIESFAAKSKGKISSVRCRCTCICMVNLTVYLYIIYDPE